MKAAIFHAGHQPLSLEEIPRPEPGPGEIVMKVAACGVCHSDLHYIDHDVKTFKAPPLILGHEASGYVAAVGAGVRSPKEGDAILLPATYSCGACFYCRTGRENICANLKMYGNDVDGSFAEYVRAPARDTLAIPKEIPVPDASIIADAISTPYYAVKYRAGVKAGDSVVVVGCGGMGINAVQAAAASGARVIAVDLNPQRLQIAKSLGAAATFNPGEHERPAKALRELAGGGVDIALEAIGKPQTIRLAFDSLRKGGRLCILGYCSEEVSLPASRIMYLEMEIVGSLGCRPVDFPSLLELIRLGKIQLAPIITGRLPLEEINKALDNTRQGVGLRTLVLPG